MGRSNEPMTTSRAQTRGAEMISRHGFLGVPAETFAEGGRRQLVALLDAGLNPESKVLEIGCGCMRAAYWLIRFLEPSCYHGIEPASQRVGFGLQYLFTPAELKYKRPRFDYNPHFDTSVFVTRFDFFLAGSIWTHASKRQIAAMLDSFVRDATAAGTFLTSYLPAQSPADDYLGDRWVGTSHESDTPGVIRHSLAWIRDQCGSSGLEVEEIALPACDGQTWLRIRRR
jgi:hypothetical protein